MGGTPKERGAVGFTELGGLLLNQLLTGRVVCVCRAQLTLIKLLCGYGGNPNEALHVAVLHGELEAPVPVDRWPSSRVPGSVREANATHHSRCLIHGGCRISEEGEMRL